MHRVQCLECRHVLTGRRHSYTEYVYCESCYRYKLQRLQGRIDNLRAEALRCSILGQSAGYTLSAGHWDLLAMCKASLICSRRLCMQAGKSPAFKAMLCNPDVQGGSEAKAPILVDIDDMSHEVLSAFVHFFYTASVEPEIMEKHSKVLYQAAEKYEVDPLKTMCEEWITKNLSDKNVLSNLELAKQYKSNVVKEAVLHAASLHIDKIPNYIDYQAYVEKNPRLLLELYEGSVKMLSQKRKRKGKVRH